MKKWQLVPVVMVLLALSVMPAAASAPTREEYDLTDDSMVVACNGFEVWDHSVEHTTFTTWLDSAGNPDHAIQSTHGVDSLYLSPGGPLTNYQEVATGTFNFDWHSTTLTLVPFVYEKNRTGTAWDVVAPGKGNILLRAGQIDSIVNETAGTFTVTKRVGHYDDMQELCDALG